MLLEHLKAAQQEPGGVRLTRVAMRCNLAYDRFRDLFVELQTLGLVKREPPYALTDPGLELLAKYRGLHGTLQELGMVSDRDPPQTHLR